MSSDLAMHGWKNFLTESRKVVNETKLLREIDEEEIDHIKDTLIGIDPKKLPLNDIFDGKFRKVLPISAYGGDIGVLQDLLNYMGYTINFKKGTASKTITKEYQGKRREKKIEVKINKLLMSALRDKEKQDKLNATRAKTRSDYFDNDCDGVGADGSENSSTFKCQELLADMKAETEKSLEQNKKIKKLYNDPSNSSDHRIYGAWRTDGLKAMMGVWQKNAAYFKNLKDDEVDERAQEFSIILSRHPIDVLRMADFKSIYSCHSPPSRGGESEYYKCAVAEAIDGGAIAYIVNTSELREMEEELGHKVEDLDADDEVFYDDYRDEGYITPLSRIRLRLLFNTEEMTGPNTLLAVPETREYGRKIPGFYTTVNTWALESQKDTISKLPKNKEGQINANKLTRMGGTYGDTSTKELLARLLGRDATDLFQPFSTIKVSGETEGALDIGDNQLAEWERIVDDHVRSYNQRMDYASVNGDVEDYGDGPFVITGGSAFYTIEKSELSASEVEKINKLSPTDFDTGAEYISAALVEDGAEWADDNNDGWESDLSWRERNGVQQLIWVTSFDPETLGLEVYGPDGFAGFCDEVETEVNDPFEEGRYKVIMKVALKNAGILEGSGLKELAWEIESAKRYSGSPKLAPTIQKYIKGWDLDGEDEDKVILTTPAYYVAGLRTLDGMPEDFGLDDVLEVVNSKEYKHNLKVAILKAAKEFKLGDHHIPHALLRVTHQTAGTSDIAFEFSFEVTEEEADSTPELVDSLKRLIMSFTDAEVLKDLMENAFLETVNQFIGKVTPDARRMSRRQQQVMRFPAKSEEPQPTAESLVKDWKKFLKI